MVSMLARSQSSRPCSPRRSKTRRWELIEDPGVGPLGQAPPAGRGRAAAQLGGGQQPPGGRVNPTGVAEHTLKAVVYDRYGSPNVLELTGIDQPVVGEDQVLVRVGLISPAAAAPSGPAVAEQHAGGSLL